MSKKELKKEMMKIADKEYIPVLKDEKKNIQVAPTLALLYQELIQEFEQKHPEERQRSYLGYHFLSDGSKVVFHVRLDETDFYQRPFKFAISSLHKHFVSKNLISQQQQLICTFCQEQNYIKLYSYTYLWLPFFEKDPQQLEKITRIIIRDQACWPVLKRLINEFLETNKFGHRPLSGDEFMTLLTRRRYFEEILKKIDGGLQDKMGHLIDVMLPGIGHVQDACREIASFLPFSAYPSLLVKSASGKIASEITQEIGMNQDKKPTGPG